MKTNYLKLIALTLSSGLFISSLPTKAEPLKINSESFISNSSNKILIAQAEDPIYKVIEKAIVRKNGYLKLKLVNPVEDVSGSVITNSPNGSKEYLIKNAKIRKKSLTWRGGSEDIFLKKSKLRIDTSKLKGLKFGQSLKVISPTTPFTKDILAFVDRSPLLVPTYGGVAAGTAAVGGTVAAASVVAPVVVAGASAAAIVGGLVLTGVAVGASSSGGSGSSSSN